MSLANPALPNIADLSIAAVTPLQGLGMVIGTDQYVEAVRVLVVARHDDLEGGTLMADLKVLAARKLAVRCQRGDPLSVELCKVCFRSAKELGRVDDVTGVVP